MSERRSDDRSLSASLFLRIDEICDRFEACWKSGQGPRIENYLGAVGKADRRELLRELLLLDIHYRAQHGCDPVASEYCDRFPDSTDLIHAVFRASATEDDENLAYDKGQPAKVGDHVAAVVGGPTREERGVVRVTCPQCGSDIQLDDPQQRQVTCVNCGSTVELDPEATTAYPILPKKIGRFHIIERLGEGTFGVVYKAYDPELDLTVAIKMARPETLDTQEKRERFLREARSAARLKHPHIVQAHDIGYERGVPYIVSEFIDGMTLDDRLSGEPLSFHEAARLVAQIAEALEYAHGEGVVHRDVKPSNTMIDHTGKPFLTDFGLAHRDEDEIGEKTLPGQILGTVAYMSPEQARGDPQAVDGRSDVYSLGVVLYKVLTSELPFRGTPRMLLHQVQYNEPAPPRRLNDQVPRDLETICLKCLEKEPRTRYTSAQALRDDLGRYLRGEPILARPIGQMTRAWRWCLRNPLVSGLAGGIVFLLILLVVVLVLWLRNLAYTHAMETELLLARTEFTDQWREIAQIDEPKVDDSIFEDPGRLYDLDVEVKIPDLARLAKKHVPALIEVLKLRSNPDWRFQAAGALGNLGDVAKEAIPRLEKVAKDDESPSKRDAQEALRDIRMALKDAIPALREAVRDSDPRVASGAEEALTKIRLALDSQETGVEDQKE